MKHQTLIGVVTTLAVLLAGIFLPPGNILAQEINFARIGAFESMGSGTVRGASPPKTIVDDNEQHAVFLTIWQSDTAAKVYWKPLSGGAAETSLIHGTGVRAYQTDGEFKIQAVGGNDRRVKYDYVLLHLRKQ